MWVTIMPEWKNYELDFTITIDYEKCHACLPCVENCPTNVFEIDEEKVARAKNRVQETLMEKGGVRLNDFIKRYGDKKQIVEKAFYDLKEEKGYSVKYMKEFGTLVLMEK